MDRDVTQNPRTLKESDFYDINGDAINSLGYLIDEAENIVDVFSRNVIFKKLCLE